jgi:undecaprenyl-diphosphatase
MEFLISIDHLLFSTINNLPHTPFLDGFFSFFSGIGSFGLIWIALGIFLAIWEEIKDKRELLALSIGILLSVIMVEVILKNLIERLRPEFSVPAIVLDRNSHSFSFPSGHATLAFVCAYILSAGHRKYRPLFYLLAFLISFSRIYLGSHYPLDVVAGFFLGLLIGWFSVQLKKYL